MSAFLFNDLTRKPLKLDIPPLNGGSAEKKATFNCVDLFDAKINAFIHVLTSGLDIQCIKIEYVQIFIIPINQANIVGILSIFSTK